MELFAGDARPGYAAKCGLAFRSRRAVTGTVFRNVMPGSFNNLMRFPKMMSISCDKEINVTGKACPMPLITLAREICIMVKGQTVRITGNDPIFEETIIEFCRERCHEILETSRTGRTVSMVIKI